VNVALVCGEAAKPVPAIDTFAVEFAVPTGSYCTAMVQVDPGLTTKPDTQVPPVIEKTPVPVSRVMVGAAVSVSGPAVAPVAVLLTVMVPFLMFVFGVPVVNTGLGALIVTVAPVTSNATVLVAPPGAVTLTFRELSVAPAVMVKVAVTVVSFTT